MSKVQGKETTLLNNLSGTEIANELDSRLRDLEKNIAVAREFIKLADESYSELRHKWNLLTEEVRNKPQTHETEHAAAQDGKSEIRLLKREHSKTRDKTVTEPDAPATPSSADVSTKSERITQHKSARQRKKDTQAPHDATNSFAPEKPSHVYRDPGRRPGKTSGRN
ncbi:MAG TPA: hypothetical protein VF906_08425 [Candidatus Bathyarchaeia archaeon]